MCKAQVKQGVRERRLLVELQVRRELTLTHTVYIYTEKEKKREREKERKKESRELAWRRSA